MGRAVKASPAPTPIPQRWLFLERSSVEPLAARFMQGGLFAMVTSANLLGAFESGSRDLGRKTP